MCKLQPSLTESLPPPRTWVEIHFCSNLTGTGGPPEAGRRCLDVRTQRVPRNPRQPMSHTKMPYFRFWEADGFHATFSAYISQFFTKERMS